MQTKPVISVILDTRRALASGHYPVKLRATFQVSIDGKKSWVRKYYATECSCSEKDFALVMGKPKTEEQRAMRVKLLSLEARANDIGVRNNYVSVELFDREFSGPRHIGVTSLFEDYIAELDKAGRIGTRDSYRSALSSFKEFGGELSFLEITTEWLDRYTTWMQTRVRTKDTPEGPVVISTGSSINTIGIYMRNLRKIFRTAIGRKYVSADMYPFSAGRYVIQSVRNPKTALSVAQKDQVLAFETEDPAVRQAVDFWIFSYFCNGMNFSDVARLKNSDIKDGVLYFNRAKTIRTARILQKVEVPLRDEALEIIRVHGRKSLNPQEFVFPILERGMTPAQQKYKVQDFIDQTNISLRLVAKALKFGFRFSTGTARHTFANVSLQAGHSKAEIQEDLGHGSIKTTEIYTGSFSIEKKRKRSMNL